MASPPFHLKCNACEYVNSDEPCTIGMTCPKCGKGAMEKRD